MTVIVAYSDGQNVYIAGDSFCGDENKRDICQTPKVYTVAGKLAVGLSGFIRQELILQQVLQTTNPEKITHDWIRFTLPDIFQKALQARGAIVEKDGQATAGDCAYILGFEGKIYILENDFGVWESRNSYTAIGSGREYALGALAALQKELPKDPELTMTKALAAAAKWCPWVMEPFCIVKV